jgi:hypothetical protein
MNNKKSPLNNPRNNKKKRSNSITLPLFIKINNNKKEHTT